MAAKKKGKKKSAKKRNADKQQKKRIARTVIITAAVIVIGFSVTAMLWGRRTVVEEAAVINILPEEKDIPEEIAAPEETASLVEQQPIEPVDFGHGKVLIIIDDVGYNLFQLEPFLHFPGPIVFAVLPAVPYSTKAAELIHAAGKSSIIHQPMQAMTVQNLGDNPILEDMDEDAIKTVINKSISEIPYALGMNNHMGSLITSNKEKMEIIMKLLQEKGMVFIDSLTTSESAVKKIAENLKQPYLHRHVFLDNEQTEEYYTAAFNEGLAKAEKEGISVLIGHVWADGLAEVLTKLYVQAENEGVTFISGEDLEETVIRYVGIGN